MNAKTIALTFAAVYAGALTAGCQSTTQKNPIDEASVSEGLVRVETRAVDAAYKRPEASLAGYSKLFLRPIEVQFAKNWDPQRSDSAIYRNNPPDLEKIKHDLAEAFAEVFKRDMEKGGYPLVDTPGPDVIEMRAAIVNLYITAPDVSSQTAGRSYVYTTDAGEMTLIMQLHDSETGQLLARAYDRRAGDGSGLWTWTTSVTNTAEAKRIISSWATALRKAFDASRTQG